MRITLVSMPWCGLDLPAISLGILHAVVTERRPTDKVTERHVAIEWPEYLFDATGGQIGLKDCHQISGDGAFELIGDWVFAAALHGTSKYRVAEYSGFLRRRKMSPEAIAVVVRMQALAPAFVDQLVVSILADDPEVVGFTTMFGQNVPSLAVAKAIKARRPEIAIIFGGANCELPMGPALQRNFPFIDYIVSGEAEESFPHLLNAIEAGVADKHLPGVSCWGSDGGQIIGMPANPVTMDLVPTPDYQAYFDRLAQTSLSSLIDPKLMFETSRGCWWGQKHRCTFCGLTTLSTIYRRKDPERALTELEGLLARYRVLDIQTTDTIMDMSYFDTFLPRLAEKDWDLCFYYEVKSNLSRAQLSTLRRAGVRHLQAGVESLGSASLRRMCKGVTGAQNIQLLRDCGELGIELTWNYLYGFPGETGAEYNSIISQMPALVHLPAPMLATRIALERYSPLFEQSTHYFDWLRPSEPYSLVYGLPEEALADIAYFFDYAHTGLEGAVEAALRAGVAAWRRDHEASSLRQYRTDEGLRLVDARVGWVEREIILADPLEVAAYTVLGVHSTIEGLARKLGAQGLVAEKSDLAALLSRWQAEGLVFEDEGRFVALAMAESPEPGQSDFIWRRGPGFALIYDYRDPAGINQFSLDGVALEAFERLVADPRLEGLPDHLRSIGESLVEAGVVTPAALGLGLPIRASNAVSRLDNVQ